MNRARKDSRGILSKALFFATITEEAFVVAARSSSVMDAQSSDIVSYSNQDTKAKVAALIDPRSIQTVGQEIPNGKVMSLYLIEWIKPEEKISGIGYVDKTR